MDCQEALDIQKRAHSHLMCHAQSYSLPFFSTLLSQIFQAMDGQEALDMLEGMESPPSVILLDVMMPNMSGYEVRVCTLVCVVLCACVKG